MYEAIAEAMETDSCQFAPEAVTEFCINEIELLDKKAAKAKERAAAKASEGDALTEAVIAVMTTDEFQPIATIAANVADEDATVAKVTYRLTQLVKNGTAEKQEVTVGGGEGSKSRKVQGYRLVAQA